MEQIKQRWNGLTDKITKKQSICTEIANTLVAFKPGLQPLQCDQKWRNLKETVKAYTDNQSTTGRGKMNKPDFFDEIMDILGDSHAIKPPYLFESATGYSDCTPIRTDATRGISCDSKSRDEGESSSSSRSKRNIDSSGSSSPVNFKKLRPQSTKERLEHKMDKFVLTVANAQKKQEEQFSSLMAMWQQQHKERMERMAALVGTLKPAKSKQRASRDSDSD